MAEACEPNKYYSSHMSTRLKRQHYVPQGYLRRFQSDNSKPKIGRIWVVDKHKDEPFNVPIQTVASRDGFYDSVVDDHIGQFEKHGVENLLRIEEEKFYTALRELDVAIRDGRDLPESVKPGIAWYLYLQFIRTAKFREGLEIPEDSLTPDFQKLTQLYGLIDRELATKFLNVCLSSIWVIYEMRGRQIMFTSDNPVVFAFDDSENALASISRNEDMIFVPGRGMKIMFPLDSKHVLFLYDRQVRSDKLQEENKITHFDSSEFYALWSAICNNCERQIYISANDGMCKVIKLLMGLDETLTPIKDMLGTALTHVRDANTSIAGTRLNSYNGYLAQKRVAPIFNALKKGESSDDS